MTSVRHEVMSETIDEAAARWFAAQDCDDMDWDAFTTWLEAGPRHRATFDAMALLGDDIALHRAALSLPLQDNDLPVTEPIARR